MIATCRNCHVRYSAADVDLSVEVNRIMFNALSYCPRCMAERNMQMKAERKAKEEELKMMRFNMLLRESGIPNDYITERMNPLRLLSVPPVKEPADYIYGVNRFRCYNMLIGGQTGYGKSTGASYAAMHLLWDEVVQDVKYCTLRELSAEYAASKTRRSGSSANAFFGRLFRHDLVIIDEFVDKSRLTDTTFELVFEIFDAVYRGGSHAKFWILGNFYHGSFKNMFVNPEPILRRIERFFLCVSLTDGGHTITRHHVFSNVVLNSKQSTATEYQPCKF